VVSAFDDIAREDEGPASHLVGRFDYLNNSGRPAATRVRAMVDEFLNRYPEAHQPEMIRRLRSRDDILHLSASFELILHELVTRQGFTTVEVEPELPNGSRPDFLVEAPDGARFYLEATLARGVEAADAGANRRLREALQAIDDVESPRFFLHLHHRGTPDQPVAVSRLRRDVQQFVDGLDFAAALAAVQAGNYRPALFRRELHGAQFVIEPFPKGTPGRADARAIGSRMLPGGLVRPHEAIRSAVEGKAGRYGRPDFPLVVAVNALDEFARAESAVDALFGDDGVAVGEDGWRRDVRARNGVWYGEGGPIFTRLSAVISTERLTFWDLGQRKARLIVNPWADPPLPDIPLGIEVRRIADGRFVFTEGRSIAELLNLPAEWPGYG